jgi:hypothetical protein
MIVDRIQQDFLRLERDFNATDGTRCCWIDNLLPQEILTAALSELPPLREMIRRKSLQERKYVSAQFDRLGAAGSLAVGFGRQEIADVVAMLLGKHRLDTDPKFYNGGLTIMVPGDFMCPHLDNSHNYERQQRRAVVLLYYMAPFWCANYGGSLELWDDDRSEPPRTVEYKPNRLVIMETTEHSWHAVQPVLGPLPRVNVTTYYYAPKTEISPLRLTRYAPWPAHRLLRPYFDAEFHMRSMTARLLGKKHLVPNRHIYRKSAS